MTQTFVRGLSHQDDQPETTFKALAELTVQTIGVRLFTLLATDTDRGLVRRIYSNMPEAYPIMGTKPIRETPWHASVLERGETFVTNDMDGVAEVFPDYELIASLGCESCINIPVTVAGTVLGTLNCLDVAGHYTPDRVIASEALKVPGAVAFLLAAARGSSL